ncbi:MAG: ribonuclease, partial [Mycobacterium sp.]|nr:ribonuclease [Mycobacterium sp.]
MTVDRMPLLKALGVELPDGLLTVALTHRSFAYENGGLPTNERL